MSKATGIETNMSDASGARVTSSAKSVGKFDSVFDTASYAASIAGPVTVASLASNGNYQGADIVSAAVNASAGYSTPIPGGYSGGAVNYGGGVRGLTTSGSVSVGGINAGLNTGNSTTDMMSMAQQQLAESQASNVSMLMIQDEMGSQNRFFTTTSNLMSSRDNMLSSIIRNVRVG